MLSRDSVAQQAQFRHLHRCPNWATLKPLQVRSSSRLLLQLNRSTGFFQLAFKLLSSFLVHTLFDGLRSVIHQLLGFLEAQTGSGANDLNDLDLLLANSFLNHVELRLLFSSSFPITSCRCGGGNRSRRADTELLFQSLDYFSQLHDGHSLNHFNQLFSSHAALTSLWSSDYAFLGLPCCSCTWPNTVTRPRMGPAI